jgi:hypothetical protein
MRCKDISKVFSHNTMLFYTGKLLTQLLDCSMRHAAFLIVCFFLLVTGKGQPAQRFDIVISEIMADPSPPVQLPNAEYIELKNVSGRTINLAGWKLLTSTSQSGSFPVYSLLPDSFLIVSSTSNTASFSAFGKALGVTSFPSLDNDGSILSLLSKEGVVVHALQYAKSWYHNEVKSEGGWSLEMIDTKNPCAGTGNWQASVSATGGTPGKINSVDGINNDESPPQLLRSFSTDSLTVVAVFDEPIDSASAAVAGNFKLDGSIVSSARPLAPLFLNVQLRLSSPLKKQHVYELAVSNVKDCKGNLVGIYNKVKAGLGEDVFRNDIVVNEILFNPVSSGEDYVEVYNRSNRVCNLSKIYIGNRTSSGTIGSLKKLYETDFFIYPSEYIVLTSDGESLARNYFVKDPFAVIILPVIPSFPDDDGNVELVNTAGDMIDEVAYSEKWHFPLITNPEGVSLERIDPDDSSASPANWHSAASTAGYGTPGYKNSQYKPAGETDAGIKTDPPVFSPDNDGLDDIEVISYQVGKAGFVANISIYNAGGILVRQLLNNGLMGLKGSWNWDGLGDKKQALPVGAYIIYTEIFNLEGKVKRFKNVVVLARRVL